MVHWGDLDLFFIICIIFISQRRAADSRLGSLIPRPLRPSLRPSTGEESDAHSSCFSIVTLWAVYTLYIDALSSKWKCGAVSLLALYLLVGWVNQEKWEKERFSYMYFHSLKLQNTHFILQQQTSVS